MLSDTNLMMNEILIIQKNITTVKILFILRLTENILFIFNYTMAFGF